MNYETIEGKRKGSVVYVHNGYLYGFFRTYKNHVRVRCLEWRRKCKAFGKIVGDQFIVQGEHTNHESAMCKEVLSLKATLKHKAETSCTSLRELFNTECAELDEDIATSVSFKSLESTMFKRRRLSYPPLPRSAEETGQLLETSDKFTSYKRMVTTEGETALIFYSDEQRQIMMSELNNKIGMDGTFKTTPRLFYQTYFFHVLKTDDMDCTHAFPVITVLMTGKSERLYKQVLRQLKQDLPSFKPVNVMADFERATRNAVRAEFPATIVNGCWFHFRQAIQRKF